MSDVKVTCPECGNKYFLLPHGLIDAPGDCIFPGCPVRKMADRDVETQPGSPSFEGGAAWERYLNEEQSDD